MAKKKAPPSGGDETVYFRKRDAQRIANTVHAYETSRRGRNPSTLPRAAGGGGGSIERVEFDGGWPQYAVKQVFYASDTTGTTTTSAVNLLCSILPSEVRRIALVSPFTDPADTSGGGPEFILVNAQC